MCHCEAMIIISPVITCHLNKVAELAITGTNTAMEPTVHITATLNRGTKVLIDKQSLYFSLNWYRYDIEFRYVTVVPLARARLA